jgi:hypothetical protein
MLNEKSLVCVLPMPCDQVCFGACFAFGLGLVGCGCRRRRRLAHMTRRRNVNGSCTRRFSGRHRKNLRTKVADFFPNQFLQPDSMKLFILKRKVKRPTRDGLVAWIVKRVKKGVLQGLIYGDALVGANLQHLSHNVKGFNWHTRELQ